MVFRVQIIAIGPLLPSIQAGLGISHGVAGALSAIPVLCMGIFAPLAPALARRLGARWALAACAGLVIAFGLLRLAVPGPVFVLALTFGIGLGMGLAGPIFPLIVRHEMPHRPALGTGAYAIGLVLGSTIAAAVAVPLAGVGGDWRFALAVITLAGLGSLAVWLGLAPPDEVRDETIAPPRIPWRRPIAWVLGLLVRAAVDALLRGRHLARGGLRRTRLVGAGRGQPDRAVQRGHIDRHGRDAPRSRPDRHASRPAGRLFAADPRRARRRRRHPGSGRGLGGHRSGPGWARSSRSP